MYVRCKHINDMLTQNDLRYLRVYFAKTDELQKADAGSSADIKGMLAIFNLQGNGSIGYSKELSFLHFTVNNFTICKLYFS